MKQMLWLNAKLLIAFGASASLGWLAIHGLDWGRVGGSFEGVSTPLILLAIFIFLVANYLRAFRWKILLIDEDVSTNRLFIIQNEGLGINNVLPFRVASEALQLAILSIRDHVDAAKGLASLGMERVIDVVASTLILMMAFFLVPEMGNFTVYVWGAACVAIMAAFLTKLLSCMSGTNFVKRFSFLSAFADAVRDLEKEPKRLVLSLLVSAIYWLMVGVTAWVAAVAVNLPISLMISTLVIMGTIFFATAVPAAPSAIGTFEFAVVYVLGFFGIDREASFSFAVIIHAIFFLPATVIAAVFLPREGILSFHLLHKAVNRGFDRMLDVKRRPGVYE